MGKQKKGLDEIYREMEILKSKKEAKSELHKNLEKVKEGTLFICSEHIAHAYMFDCEGDYIEFTFYGGKGEAIEVQVNLYGLTYYQLNLDNITRLISLMSEAHQYYSSPEYRDTLGLKKNLNQ